MPTIVELVSTTPLKRYVRGGVELLPELKSFETEFNDLRNKYAHGMVSLG